MLQMNRQDLGVEIIGFDDVFVCVVAQLGMVVTCLNGVVRFQS